MAHAIVSPSGWKKWFNCSMSARLEEKFEDVESSAAKEGTLAHAICEALLKNFLTNRSNYVPVLTLEQWHYFKVQEFYTEAMYEYAQDFARFVLSLYSEGDYLFVEELLNLRAYIPEGFGTSDASVMQVAKKHLHVPDFKYGKGVPVDAEDNGQLKIYALGVIELIAFLDFEIEWVTVHIFQPRIDNNSSFTISYAELLAWGEEQLKPAAKAAFEGTGMAVAGDHCLFCKAKPRCKALAEYNKKLLGFDFADPAFLSDEEVIEILEIQGIVKSWLKAVDDYTLTEAVKGHKWPGYKLVEGRADRVYVTPDKLAQHLNYSLNLGDITQVYKPRELLGITEMTKKLGTEKFNKLVGPYLHKPAGKPTLVPETDERPVYNRAKLDFNDGYVDADEYDDL